MKTKKFFSIFMAVAIMVCGIHVAFAKPVNNFEAEAEQLISLYLSSSPKAKSIASASSATLHEKIPAYIFQDGSLEPLDNADYYPVSVNDNVIGIFTVNYDGTGGEVYTFSSEFAEEWNVFTVNNEQACMVFDDTKMYLMGPTAREKVYDGHGYSLNFEDEPQALSADSFEDADVDIKDINFYNVKPSNSIATMQLQNNKARATGRHQVNIELWNQNNSSSTKYLCWAGTVWSIGSHLTGSTTSWTPVKIAKQILGNTGYNDGVLFSEIPDIYDTIYGLDVSREYGQVPFSDIVSNIDSDTPLHSSWQSPNYGHSMAIVGYGNNEEICVNDTNIGDYKWLKKNATAEDWRYTWGETYTWSDTIVF